MSKKWKILIGVLVIFVAITFHKKLWSIVTDQMNQAASNELRNR